MTEAEFETWLAKPHDAVLEQLGRTIYQPPIGALPASAAEFAEMAKRWLENQRTTICRALYSSEAIRDYIEGKQPYRLAQIGGILLDFLALTYGKPTAGWMSVALLQLGLEQFCPPSGVAT